MEISILEIHFMLIEGVWITSKGGGAWNIFKINKVGGCLLDTQDRVPLVLEKNWIFFENTQETKESFKAPFIRNQLDLTLL